MLWLETHSLTSENTLIFSQLPLREYGTVILLLMLDTDCINELENIKIIDGNIKYNLLEKKDTKSKFETLKYFF